VRDRENELQGVIRSLSLAPFSGAANAESYRKGQREGVEREGYICEASEVMGNEVRKDRGHYEDGLQRERLGTYDGQRSRRSRRRRSAAASARRSALAGCRAPVLVQILRTTQGRRLLGGPARERRGQGILRLGPAAADRPRDHVLGQRSREQGLSRRRLRSRRFFPLPPPGPVGRLPDSGFGRRQPVAHRSPRRIHGSGQSGRPPRRRRADTLSARARVASDGAGK